MSSLFYRILESRDLSKAGDLFSVEDSVIVSEFNQISTKIQEISSAPEFLTCHNDQSLVEIIVTRIISAVRETNSIQQHARCLVDLLSSCLAHSLRPGPRGDPPHAKMASDIMSCLFLNYNKKSVMVLAIPTAVKFLHKGNKDLSRNMSSYLSLAAIENADLLAKHVQPILDSVISGNYSLSRVLPAIFSVDRQLIMNHVMTLVSILPNCADSDSLALLTLFNLVAKDSPRLLEPSIPQLCECLSQQSLALATLQVMEDVALVLPQCLHDHVPAFKATASNFPSTTVAVVQLLAVVSQTNLDRSRDILNYLMEVIGSVETEKHSLVLKEVSTITGRYPSLLDISLINKITGLQDSANSATMFVIEDLKNEYNLRRVDRSFEKLSVWDSSSKPTIYQTKPSNSSKPNGVTVVSVKGGGGSIKNIHRRQETEPEKVDLKSSISIRQSGSNSISHIPVNDSYQTGSIFHTSNKPDTRAERISKIELNSGGGGGRELSSGARVELTSVTRHDRDFNTYHESGLPERQVSRSKFPESRSIGRIPTHRSMTRLNMHNSANRLEHRMIHKSMTRLDNRYISQPPPNSIGGQKFAGPPPGAMSPTKSMSSGSVSAMDRSGSALDRETSAVLVRESTATAGRSASGLDRDGGGRVGVPDRDAGRGVTGHEGHGRGVTGLDGTGREILTVNINQITTDLARQSSQLSSVFSRPLPTDYRPEYRHHPAEFPSYAKLDYAKFASEYKQPPEYSRMTNDYSKLLPGIGDRHDYRLPDGRDSSLPPVTAGSSQQFGGGSSQPFSGSSQHFTLAPLSLPAHKRTHPTHSSGPIYSTTRIYSSGPLPSLQQQPASLGSQPPAVSGSASQPLDTMTAQRPEDDNRSSEDRIIAAARANQDKMAALMHHADLPRTSFSNTLPSLRRRSHCVTSASINEQSGLPNKNRISVFEPYPMRDTVQHFCEKHLDKIKSYMESVCVKIPLPVKCTIEERKGKKHAKLHFACQGRGEHCLYKVTFYTLKSRHPTTWIHLMFLALQARSQSALSTRDTGVSSLKNCWEIIKCEEKSFSTLVTGAFPPAKDQDSIIHELRSHRFFDVFEYNAPLLQWGCFLCNHPERATTFLTEEVPVIEGQLKEKSGGKWKIFKKWKSRYFTLSGARLVYKENKETDYGTTQALDVGSIRSVKVSKGGHRNIPKAFEIFTADKTYVLKAKDSSNAQEWVQCLTVAVAHSQAKESTLRRLAYGGSLGRLTHGSRINPGLNSHHITLRTAV